MRWPRVLVAALVLSLLAGAVPAWAQRIHGRIRQSWSRITTDADDDGTDMVLQDYQFTFRNMVARNLSWQMRLRALLRGSDRDDGTTGSDTMLFEPFLQVVYEGPEWSASAGTRLTRVAPKGDHSGAQERERRDYFGRVGWNRQIQDRHGVSAVWSISRLELEKEDIDTTIDDRSLLTVAYTARPGSMTLGLENRGLDDLITGFTRDSTEITGSGNFRHSFRGARLTVTGRALFAEQESKEHTPDQDDVLVERRPRRGLFGVDSTPTADLLTETPGLIDGDLTTSTADLDGRDRNFGVDMGFVKDLEKVYLYTERRLQIGNEKDYSWEIYVSNDGDIWTFLSNAADGLGSRFEPLRNRFEIDFSATQTRYLKVVNTDFSGSEVPLGVTEIEVLDIEQRVGTTTRESSRQSGNVSLAWRPARTMDMNLHVIGTRQSSDGPSGDQSEEDLSSTLTSVFRPGKVTAMARLQAVNRDSTQGRPERDRVASLTLAGSPVRDLDLSATGTRRRNRTPGEFLSGRDTINLRTAARLASHTQTSLDLTLSRQDQRDLDRITTRRTGHVALVTTLRPSLLVTSDWTAIRLEFDSPEEIPSRTDLDLRTRVSYRPSPALGGSVEYLYQDIAGREGFSRLLDLDWIPFPGGAIQIQFTFVRDRLAQKGATRDEDRVGLRWTLNPRTLLESSYGTVRRGDEDLERKTRSVSVFLEFRF
jgi:hypothetical protein